ncbi:hypothetical protein [Bradyrhizobium oropedii]|uniref:hypothetical protein n=1 Tax=Bradyrhizobium oropedii TaxID=1571201 RepID=UPI001E3A5EFF|nr:hypothetical protein [Bradyrhizobium oropedii]
MREPAQSFGIATLVCIRGCEHDELPCEVGQIGRIGDRLFAFCGLLLAVDFVPRIDVLEPTLLARLFDMDEHLIDCALGIGFDDGESSPSGAEFGGGIHQAVADLANRQVDPTLWPLGADVAEVGLHAHQHQLGMLRLGEPERVEEIEFALLLEPDQGRATIRPGVDQHRPDIQRAQIGPHQLIPFAHGDVLPRQGK